MPILRAIRRLLVVARNTLDGHLHPRRRRRALERLAEITPSSVLFVCLGNICRSPYAERVMATEVSIPVASAGFIGPGRNPPEAATRVARARGVDHADHLSRTLTSETLAAADVTFVFDRFNVRRLRRVPGFRKDRLFWLGDFDPTWTGRRAIVDPWGKPDGDFEVAFGRIERCVDEVVRSLGPEGSHTAP